MKCIHIYLVVVMDEGNSAAENGIEGGISYVEKNNLGTVSTKQLLALEDMEPFQAIEKRIFLIPFLFNNKNLHI